MMKKITPVFGPQDLFDGATNCDGYLVAVQHSVGQKTKVSFYPSLVEAFNYVVDFPPRGVVFHRAAMRRIEDVAEPNRWTVEDQQAGRLPDVGSEYVGQNKNCTPIELTCLFVDGDSCVWGYSKTNEVYSFIPKNIKPIETPEERAKREEDEFYTGVKNKWGIDTETCLIDKVALFELGVRTAYRELKTPEPSK
jgi:hypothetical protein